MLMQKRTGFHTGAKKYRLGNPVFVNSGNKGSVLAVVSGSAT